MNYVYEYPTGYGKTKKALDTLKELNLTKVLIVIPRLALIKSWKEEIVKWDSKIEPTFTTYVSLKKYKLGLFEATIFDECHHISERCMIHLLNNTSLHNILLSATLSKDLKERIRFVFKIFNWEKKMLKEAIKEKVLPKPKILGIPLELSEEQDSIFIDGKRSSKVFMRIHFNQLKAMRKKYPSKTFEVICSEKQWYEYNSKKIDYWKENMFNCEWKRNRYLHLCGDRLKFLASIKTKHVKNLLETAFRTKRAIIFCNTIEQTEQLGVTCIHSKNFNAPVLLQEFNDYKIDKIATVNQLNEGVNLTECQYGIFNCLNSSSIMNIQKIGRLLRHNNPRIVIPYFKNTREEEIFNTKIKSLI